MSTTYPCETCGSQSATSDYCDTCGAAILGPAGGRPAAGPMMDVIDPPDLVAPPDLADLSAVRRAGSSKSSSTTCYFCGAPRNPEDEACDVCGVDFESGLRPAAAADPTPIPPAPVPADLPDVSPAASTSDSLVMVTPPAVGDTVVTAAPVGWTAVVGADRAYFAGNVTAGVVAFPDGLAPREVPLSGDEVSIGRRSESKGYFPDIDLSAPVDDPAVSRRHAVLRRQGDGSWILSDVGSTNGTWLNDEEEPLAQGMVRPLQEGDRILLGAFTCITIRGDRPPPA